jgi:hypothetical protein
MAIISLEMSVAVSCATDGASFSAVAPVPQPNSNALSLLFR